MGDITSTDVAFMIRNDGTVFSVKTHIYSSLDTEEIEDILYANEWLYNHTGSKETKNLVLELFHSWLMGLIKAVGLVDYNKYDIISLAKEEIDDREGIDFVSFNFIKEHINDILRADLKQFDLLNKLSYRELNQEFLRARYGGMYDSSKGSKDIYFRISSVSYNWFNIIWDFVINNKDVIDYVTVVADAESTGKKDFYYKHKGREIKRMPVDEFLTLSGVPVFEGMTSCGRSLVSVNLMRGKTIIESGHFMYFTFGDLLNYYNEKYNNFHSVNDNLKFFK